MKHRQSHYWYLVVALLCCNLDDNLINCQDTDSETTTLSSTIIEDSSETKAAVEPTKYLRQFGYMTENQGGSGDSLAEDAFEEAVREYQRFMGIPETGRLDKTTKEWMSKARCGVKDFDRSEFVDGQRDLIEGKPNEGGISRRKRYAFMGSKWPRKSVSYRIVKYSGRRSLSKRSTDLIVERAFKTWSEAANIDFKSKKRGSVDILVSFEKGSHCLSDSFGTPASGDPTLAHAFSPGNLPISGDVHINDNYIWTAKDNQDGDKQPLYSTVVHELGHSMGLSHSNEKEAIMYPVANGASRLNKDDVRGIRELYGKRAKSEEDDDKDADIDPEDKFHEDLEEESRASNSKDKEKTGICENGVKFSPGPSCKYLYDCRHSKPWLRKCPRNLVWNKDKDLCDWPWNVPDCKSKH